MASARFNGAGGIAADPQGNLYVADSDNHIIRMITPGGIVTTLAGTPGVTGSANGQGSQATFNTPVGLAYGKAADGQSYLFVADYNHIIRKISSTAVVSPVAGSPGTAGFKDGQGAAAQFNYPDALAFDPSGNLYVADYSNNAIRMITPTGMVSTFAGTGTAGATNASPATAATFSSPNGLAFDSHGNLLVSDSGNSTLREVSATGVVTTFAGGALANGPGAQASFKVPAGLAFDASDNLYVADSGNNNITKLTTAGAATTLAGAATGPGNANGAGTMATFNQPQSLAFDGSGNLLVADFGNSLIRRVTPAGMVSTLAGVASSPGNANGPGLSATFKGPGRAAVRADGTILVPDSGNGVIRQISPAGVVSNWPVTDTTGNPLVFSYPRAVALDPLGTAYVADKYANVIYAITSEGVASVLAGSSLNPPGSLNGTGAAASFNGPDALALDGNGNLYVSDSGNNTIRKITLANGVVATLAGSANLPPGHADGTGAAATFNFPCGLAASAQGIVYVADGSNNTIRAITPDGVVSTLVGTSGVTGHADGLGNQASFNGPDGLFLSGTSLYATDFSNGTIRQVILNDVPVVTTIAGVADGGLNDLAPGVNTTGTPTFALTQDLFYPRDITGNPATGTLVITMDDAVLGFTPN